MNMRRAYTQSEAIRSVGYDNKKRTLEIEFESGRTYRYFRVAPHVHQAMLRAESKGRFFNWYIKNVYTFEEI
jgi:hypothetical protein